MIFYTTSNEWKQHLYILEIRNEVYKTRRNPTPRDFWTFLILQKCICFYAKNI